MKTFVSPNPITHVRADIVKRLTLRHMGVAFLLALNLLLVSSLAHHSTAATLSSDPFSAPVFDAVLTHDGGQPCGMVSASSPMLADLDGDGSLEIVVGTLRNTLTDGGYAACLAVLNSNGSIRWSHVMIGSINSTPAVGDINGDGKPDIVVGLGAENEPPTPGGVVAFDRNGNQLWYYQTADRIGNSGNPNGLPDGVWASPAIVDVNNDGQKQIVVGAWDGKIHLINGSNGTAFAAPGNNLWPAEMLDTIWSSPAIADLNSDGRPDFIFGGDTSANGPACTSDGGLLRVMYNQPGVGPTHLPGFNTQYGCLAGTGSVFNIAHYGLSVDQSLYSSPVVGDFGSRGKLIIIGSGCAFPIGTNCDRNGSGKWVKIWDRNGNLVATLPTDAPIFGSPALADINGDGVPDIIVGTMGRGWIDGTGAGGTLYAWSGAPGFPLLWARKPGNFVNLTSVLISSSPSIADLNGDGQPEILVGYAGEIEVFDHNGNQLTEHNGTVEPSVPTLWLGRSPVNNSPAVGDLDQSGTLKIVGAGSFCDPTTGVCDGMGRGRAWSASVLGLLNPAPAGRAPTAKLPWPMFRREPTHQAFATTRAAFAPIAPAALNLSSLLGSNIPLNANITLTNVSPVGANYTVNYSTRVSGPTAGTIGPNATVTISIEINPSGLGAGTYNLSMTINAANTDNGVQSLPITLTVEKQVKLFLPFVKP